MPEAVQGSACCNRSIPDSQVRTSSHIKWLASEASRGQLSYCRIHDLAPPAIRHPLCIQLQRCVTESKTFITYLNVDSVGHVLPCLVYGIKAADVKSGMLHRTAARRSLIISNGVGDVAKYLSEAASSIFKTSESNVPWEGSGTPFSGEGLTFLRRSANPACPDHSFTHIYSSQEGSGQFYTCPYSLWCVQGASHTMRRCLGSRRCMSW